MSQDFIIVPNTAKMPTEKAEQIALILHRSVHQELYRVFQSTDALRHVDPSQFFTVTFDDLLAHLVSHPDEFHALLPTESWDGFSVVRDGTHYSFRYHFRGLVTGTEPVEGIHAAAARWLRCRLIEAPRPRTPLRGSPRVWRGIGIGVCCGIIGGPLVWQRQKFLSGLGEVVIVFGVAWIVSTVQDAMRHEEQKSK